MPQFLYACSFVCLFFGVDYRPITFLKMYNIKSAIVCYNSSINMPPINKKIVRYFDDFGRKETVIVEPVLVDAFQSQKVIKLGDIQYMLMDTLQCIKAIRKKTFSLDNLDVSMIDEKSIQQYGIKKVGDCFYLKKKCIKYSIDNPATRLKGEIITWQNIPLLIILDRNGIVEKTEAYKIETEVVIDSNIFEIPKNIEILDMTSVDNN